MFSLFYELPGVFYQSMGFSVSVVLVMKMNLETDICMHVHCGLLWLTRGAVEE